MSELAVLFLGDVVGRTGRSILTQELKSLRLSHKVDLVIANGENASGGLGLDYSSALELFKAGADVITLGDHAFKRKDLVALLAPKTGELPKVIRPANFPAAAPGQGATIWVSPTGVKVGIINLIGRVFIELPLDCPFTKAAKLISELEGHCDLILCDLHAEATSEKVAFGIHFAEKLHLVVGTHTHVPTADYRIIKQRCGYVTDLGMCGPREGVIGMDPEVAIARFLSGVPQSYKLAEGPPAIMGVYARFDTALKRCIEIRRIDQIYQEG